MRRRNEDHAQSTRCARGAGPRLYRREGGGAHEEGQTLEKILAHVDAQDLQPDAVARPSSRAPPQLEIDDDWL